MPDARRPPPPGHPVTVVFGRPRFSADHQWSDVPAAWTGDLRSLTDRVIIEHTGHNQLGARLLRARPPVHVVVPVTSPVTAQTIARGSFGLIQQFGAGTDVIDLTAAARCGVQVANMPGLNAVPVAEHAITLLLALARRIPEAGEGFRSGHWGEPAGRSLAGTTATVIGLGAVGTQVARRLAAFDVAVTGIRRRAGAVPPPVPGMCVTSSEHLHDALRTADAVIIAASHRAGQPPAVDADAIAAMRPGALLVNVARGGLLDNQAALRAVRAGRLGGLGLDVFPQEPYPADGPLTSHPRVIATAHTAALTSGFFRDAAWRLGAALHRWINGLPPDNLLVPLPHAGQPSHCGPINVGDRFAAGKARPAGTAVSPSSASPSPGPSFAGAAAVLGRPARRRG